MPGVQVRIPASTANVGPGYDVFGIAVSLYNTITIEKSEKLEISVSGVKSDSSLPLNENNLVYQAINAFYQKINKRCPLFKININCEIPLASGLGSSSTAIVGGIAAANMYEGSPLSTDDIITLAWEVEGHPDNTTAAILGGFVISTITQQKSIAYKKLHWPDKWKLLIAHPDFKLSTQEARAVIPKTIPLSDAIFNMSCCSFLVAAVCTADEELLKLALQDKLHQPHRAKLVPGLNEIIQTLQNKDVLGVALSGAGPSICVIGNEESLIQAANTIKEVWSQNNIASEFFYPDVDNHGVHYSEI